MNVQDYIRRVEGSVDINFFANSMNDEIVVSDSSRNDFCADKDCDTDPFILPYRKQLFTANLKYERKIATLSAENDPNRVDPDGTVLCKDFHLAGNDSLVGWFSDQVCDADGKFAKNECPFLELKFSQPREIHFFDVLGSDVWGEYPTEFLLELRGEDYIEIVRGRTLAGEEMKGYTQDDGVKIGNGWHIKLDEPTIFQYAKLYIIKWSRAYTTAKIGYFCSEKVITFCGKDIKSLEILEEKSGDADKLSYGLSSNICKVQFVNQDKQFYLPVNYALLKKKPSYCA